MARPTKLCERHIELMDDYIEGCGDTYEKFTKSSSESLTGGSESHGYRLKVELPTLAGLQLFFRKASKTEKNKDLRVSASVIKLWRTKGKDLSTVENLSENDELLVEFMTSFEELLSLQEKMLLDGGISNQYGQVITKMMLNVNHGYKETNIEEVKHSGSVDLGGFFGNNLKKKDSLINKE